jgi:hypothetical protein
MAKKRQTMTKRALHRKLKIGQNITPQKLGVNSVMANIKNK